MGVSLRGQVLLGCGEEEDCTGEKHGVQVQQYTGGSLGAALDVVPWIGRMEAYKEGEWEVHEHAAVDGSRDQEQGSGDEQSLQDLVPDVPGEHFLIWSEFCNN